MYIELTVQNPPSPAASGAFYSSVPIQPCKVLLFLAASLPSCLHWNVQNQMGFSEDMHDAFVHRLRQKIEMDRSRQHSRQRWTSGGIYIGGDDNSGIDKGDFWSCC